MLMGSGDHSTRVGTGHSEQSKCGKEHWVSTACLLSEFFFFFPFLSVPWGVGVQGGAKGEKFYATAQWVCFQSNGMLSGYL